MDVVFPYSEKRCSGTPYLSAKDSPLDRYFFPPLDRQQMPTAEFAPLTYDNRYSNHCLSL
jgi:hypothetical protein